MGQIELFDVYTVCNKMTYAKLNCLKEVFNHLTVCPVGWGSAEG